MSVLAHLPRGVVLTDDQFRARHRLVSAVLALHIPVIAVLALLNHGEPAVWVVLGAAAAALMAATVSTRRRTQAVLASVGLLLCADALVHAGGGLTDLHFHFFVVLALVSIYQDWVPFLLSVVLVAVHHVGVSMLFPDAVFSDPRAQANPLPWALLHALFVLLMCAVLVVGWGFAERAERAGMLARAAAEDADRLRIEEELRNARERQETAAQLAAELEERERLQSEVASAIEALEQLAQNVRAGTAQAEVSLDELNGVVDSVSVATRKASDTSAEAHEASRATAAKMEELSAASHAIAGISASISGIAEQTNLLALNATIEAARSGEAGRGFAVVAGEVKELARETSSATERIGSVVSTVAEETELARQAAGRVQNTLAEVAEVQRTVQEAVEAQVALAAAVRHVVLDVGQQVQTMAATVARIAKSPA